MYELLDQKLTESFEQELEGVAFVPLDGRPDLKDLSAFSEPEIRVAFQHCSHLLSEAIPFLLGHAAEMHREAELVVLHHGARDGLHLLRQRLEHLG